MIEKRLEVVTPEAVLFDRPGQPLLAQPMAEPENAVSLPWAIRKAISTASVLESLDSVIRKAIKKQKLFPAGDSGRKVFYFAMKEAEEAGDTDPKMKISIEPVYDQV